jgi:hypothetical protein
LEQNSSATSRKPKPGSAGLEDQSLFKEQKDSIFFVRGVSLSLTNGGLISVDLLHFLSVQRTRYAVTYGPAGTSIQSFEHRFTSRLLPGAHRTREYFLPFFAEDS